MTKTVEPLVRVQVQLDPILAEALRRAMTDRGDRSLAAIGRALILKALQIPQTARDR